MKNIKYKPGEVVSAENPAGTSFAWTNGLYVVVKALRTGEVYFSRLDKSGQPNVSEESGKYSCMVTGQGNSNLKKTPLTCKIDKEKI